MPTAGMSRVSVNWILVLLSFVLAGCYMMADSTATPDELGSVREGKTVAVLVRFVAKDRANGEPLKPFEGQITSALLLSIGDFASGGVPSKEILPGFLKSQPVRPYPGRLLSVGSQAEGWMFLFLPPGYYYLGLGLPYISWAPAPLAGKIFTPGSPEWRVEVPSGTPVVYAGTFHISVRSDWRAYDQSATRIEDDSGLAAEVSRRELSSLPPPVTRLAARHTGPHLLGVPAAVAPP